MSLQKGTFAASLPGAGGGGQAAPHVGEPEGAAGAGTGGGAGESRGQGHRFSLRRVDGTRGQCRQRQRRGWWWWWWWWLFVVFIGVFVAIVLGCSAGDSEATASELTTPLKSTASFSLSSDAGRDSEEKEMTASSAASSAKSVGWMDTGTIFITDRHILLFSRRKGSRVSSSRKEKLDTSASLAGASVRIIALASIQEVKDSGSDSLELCGAKVLTIRLDEKRVMKEESLPPPPPPPPATLAPSSSSSSSSATTPHDDESQNNDSASTAAEATFVVVVRRPWYSGATIVAFVARSGCQRQLVGKFIVAE